MAALTQDQVTRVYDHTGARSWSLFQIKDVSGADTANLLDLGFFRVIKQAVWVGATVSAIAAAAVTAPATVTAPAQMNHDSAYLLVDGVPV